MKRSVIRIDEEKCTGCGLCVAACQEGALQIVNGKAKLVSESYCDGLGACLPECPTGALTIEEREAQPFDPEAVAAAKAKGQEPPVPNPHATRSHAVSQATAAISECGCPGARTLDFRPPSPQQAEPGQAVPSELRQWPIQLHLVNPAAPYFQNADVLLTADCVAYARGDYHPRYLRGRSLAIACPKLDANHDRYEAKIKELIDTARVNTLTVIVMEVPCCQGLVALAQRASSMAARKVPIRKIVIGLQGDILEDAWL